MTLHAYLSPACEDGRCHSCQPLETGCTHQCHVTLSEAASTDSADAGRPAPPPDVARTEPAAESVDGAADVARPVPIREGRQHRRGNTPTDELPRTGSTP